MISRISNVLRQLADRGSSSSIAPASGKLTVTNPRENGYKTSTELLTQLHAFYESREQELKEQEAALDKKLQLFQQTYPHAGNQSDVLHLNVGGSTNVAVFRRTLTRFENSLLASQFSGRWDDSLEKTKCGSFFIDQDPKVFLPLLNYLRQCDHNTSSKVKILPPPPTPEFCSMLEYYGLLSSIYPQQWRQVGGPRDGVVMTKSPNDDSFTISSKTWNSFAMDVMKPLNVTSFTAVFEEGSTGQVGWAVDLKEGKSLGAGSGGASFGFDVGDSKFVSGGACSGGYRGHVDRHPLPRTIVGTRDPTSNRYSIQVMDNGDDPDATSTCKLYDEYPMMFPHIILQGEVTLSNVLHYQLIAGNRLVV